MKYSKQIMLKGTRNYMWGSYVNNGIINTNTTFEMYCKDILKKHAETPIGVGKNVGNQNKK